MTHDSRPDNGEIIIYQSDDGKINLDVRLENKTVWLTQDQIAQLFNKGRSTITEHINNIFKENELDKEMVCRKFRHTTPHGAIEGKSQTQEVQLYNLDVIISVGYRVKSKQGTRFRQWATERLAEYRKYQVKTLSPVEQAYLESIKMIEHKAKGDKQK
ncbi:MAG: virulence RhuM family protein [Bacteroidaceae bacterium]|nr:virulence RhuM family protein [Bacteroidaceae bacterium]